MKVKIIISGVIIISAVTVIVLFANKWRTGGIQGKITVRGNLTLTAEEILGAANLRRDSVINTSELNLYFIQDRISKHPEIKRVSVTKEPPDDIIIEVVEKTPVAIVNTGTALNLVDEEFDMFSFNNFEKIYDLPIITGVKADPVSSQKTNKDLRLAVGLVRSTFRKSKYLQNMISEINMSDSAKIIVLTNDRSVPFYFPRYSENSPEEETERDMSFRLDMFSRFIENVYLKDSGRDYEYVDLRYSNQVIAKN